MLGTPKRVTTQIQASFTANSLLSAPKIGNITIVTRKLLT